MKIIILLLLTALALAPRTSGADNGCKMTDYPDHVEVDCEQTTTPEAPRTPPADAPPWPYSGVPADNTPVDPPVTIEPPAQAETPPVFQENSFHDVTEPGSGRQRRPDGTLLERARAMRYEQITGSRQ